MANVEIEVVFANERTQKIIALQVPIDCTVQQAIERSGILKKIPEIDLSKNKVGIFSNVVNLEDIVHAGDRIEIYQPLSIDPKQIRKRRAIEQINKKS